MTTGTTGLGLQVDEFAMSVADFDAAFRRVRWFLESGRRDQVNRAVRPRRPVRQPTAGRRR